MNRLNESILLTTHTISFEDEIRQICLNYLKYMDIWSIKFELYNYNIEFTGD